MSGGKEITFIRKANKACRIEFLVKTVDHHGYVKTCFHRHGSHGEAKLDMVTSVVVTSSDLDISAHYQEQIGSFERGRGGTEKYYRVRNDGCLSPGFGSWSK